MLENDIAEAMAAHALWKVRLKSAIATGQLDVSVQTIRVDDACPFGQWLHGTSIPADVTRSPAYEQVKRLHAEFHRVAGQVAELVLAGKKADAEKELGHAGAFGLATRALTDALRTWKP